MSQRPPKEPPSPAECPSAPDAAPPRSSGRVQFDSRGQAVWEWAVKTGMFDRNASTQRIKALVETPLELSLEGEAPAADAPASAPDARARAGAMPPGSSRAARGTAPRPAAGARPSPVAKPAGSGSGNIYERAGPATPAKPRPDEGAGFDPYSRGPAKRPESVSFNPYERVPPRKP